MAGIVRPGFHRDELSFNSTSIVSMIIAARGEMAREIVVDVYSPFIYHPINIKSKFGLIGEPIL